MRTKFTHGPSMGNSNEYEIGPYILSEEEALQVAYSIMGHFRPKAGGQQRLGSDENLRGEIEIG